MSGDPSRLGGASPSRALMTASQWLAHAEARSAALRRSLQAVYGPSPETVEGRFRRVAEMARLFIASFGDRAVVVARAPGRVNLMGRHVDHQGGHCNMMAIEGDVYIMAASAGSDLLRLRNVEGTRFPAVDAPLQHLLAGYTGQEWELYVGSAEARDRARQASGAWHYYVQAALARIAAEHPSAGPSGLDAVVAGNVPLASGLSSSSAVVVSAMEAVIALRGLDLAPQRLAELASEAEWYVGTRGGAGDQAAMKFARTGCVVQLGFHPMSVGRIARWPQGFALLVANSLQQARKSDGARDRFNQRVACYHIGREMLLVKRPHLRDRVEHLRDLTPHRLGWPDSAVADMLHDLPCALRRDQIAPEIGDEMAERLLLTHDCGDDAYRVRSVVLFGLAECERSRRCADDIAAGAMDRIGRLMNVSHDGDRVTSTDARWQWSEGRQYPDADLDDVVRRCDYGETLADQPGGYACSTARLDSMVDAVLQVEGVLGAQLSGAGLGGCMMALMRESSVDAARDALIRRCYEPWGLEPSLFVCRPVAGCGPIVL